MYRVCQNLCHTVSFYFGSGPGYGSAQCGGSGMFIPDPGSWFLPIPDPGSRIPDPKTGRKERGEKKNFVKYFFVATNFTKCKIINFWTAQEKIWAKFQRIMELFTQKVVTKLSKIWIWDPESGIRDPGSGINLFRIPDPGFKKAPNPGSGSATLVRPLRQIQIINTACWTALKLLQMSKATKKNLYAGKNPRYDTSKLIYSTPVKLWD